MENETTTKKHTYGEHKVYMYNRMRSVVLRYMYMYSVHVHCTLVVSSFSLEKEKSCLQVYIQCSCFALP